MDRPFKVAIFVMIVVAEVLLLDAASKAQNQPLSFDVVETVKLLTFVFNYFHVPLWLSVALAILSLAIPALLIMLLISWLYGVWVRR